MESIIFKSSYFLRIINGEWNPFTGNKITISDDYIEFSKRNWHLISVDTNTIHFRNVIGLNINKHLISATIVINSNGMEEISIVGFGKRTADEIKKECELRISNTHNRSYGGHNAAPSSTSIADEIHKLKQLLDQGIISQNEFEKMKQKLID